MNSLFVIGEDQSFSPQWSTYLQNDARVEKAVPGEFTNVFDRMSFPGVVVVIPCVSAIPHELISTVMDNGLEHVRNGENVVFSGSGEEGQALSTAAAAYFFNAEDVHYIGGLDGSLDALTMAMDVMFRLNARGNCVKRYCLEGLESSFPSVLTYMNVLSRNLDPQLQAYELAPLMLGVLSGSMADIDILALDLQASPGGENNRELNIPSRALSGARLLRRWTRGMKRTKAAGDINFPMNRIPGKRLPGLTAFIDEMWMSTELDPAYISLLRESFEDVSPYINPDVLFVCSLKNEMSYSRMMHVTSLLSTDVYVWDTDGNALFLCSEGHLTEIEKPQNIFEQMSVIVFVGAALREVIGVRKTHAMVLLDMTTTDILALMREDYRSFTEGVTETSVQTWNETIEYADRIIVSSTQQRDLYLGYIAGLKRLNAMVYDEDHAYNSLVAVEDGTTQIVSAIKHPRKSLDNVDSIPLYKKTPYGMLSKRTAQGVVSELVKKSGDIADRAKGSDQK
ncbi:hypothetical protein [Arcanobacterium buesumense]|uniref:Uncharacterized protein n=1 Tax=Arcanobacterium buesumense TaxID=2722751 RepID=A0A6H2EKB1_9ACTO|nr:hypothetical protein [Arcanobacterium buesumense]QJC21117.1 hypothetical protein HC352_00345 [Arcanobacterium buesumense]